VIAGYMLVYIVVFALALPVGAVMTLVGGALFGIVRGALYSLAGAIVGSAAAFLIARYAARDLVARHLAARPRFAAVERAVSARGRTLVLLLRLSPVVPFNALNYLLGLSTVSFGDFLLGSVGMIPGTFMYAYAGRLAGEAAAWAGQAATPHDASYYVLLTVGLAATILAVVSVTRTARRALRDV
jgi:uncharacterized membrane protein YdjX (TVP38/TMEM64 family)